MPRSTSPYVASSSTTTSPTQPTRDHGDSRIRARAWTAHELSGFLAAARSQRLYPALHLTAHTGMRRGEVVGLQWSDLDRTTKRLSITRTLQNVAGHPIEFDVKTRTSRRSIDLDDNTMWVLAQWRQKLYRDGLPHGPDDWMFLNQFGRFLNPESVSQLSIASSSARSPCRESDSTTYATPTPRC